MQFPDRHSAALGFALVFASAGWAALGDPSLLGSGAPDDLALVSAGRATPLVVSANDWPGVRRAAGDLQADIVRVTGLQPALVTGEPSAAPAAVLIGTLGRSALIDGLVASGKLDASPIRGRWEAFIIGTVEQPVPGVDRALVIAGSDKRGTIYGIYELSQQIGVSPWYWWADVPPPHRDALFIQAGRHVDPGPAVKYRGIFLNDEAPDLTNWVRARYGAAPVSVDPPVPGGIANYGHEFYARIFEVMLRLRANYLWPAMWNNAFNEDDPANARLADEYGIVMGTSHQEPMLRAQKEWDRRYKATLGSWNYVQHPDVLENFWREGVRRNRDCESIITMGLRGADDTPMAPGGPAANRALLERIVANQRDILRAEVNPDLAKVPQVWCLYKEVQEFYDAGMRVPDDVTLLWAEDNWGNVRRLPTPEERKRPGGAGIYYHFDYHGGPRSYQWLNSNPLPKIWDQMSLARQYGADRIWIVNVGHFKGYEVPTEFFLRLAWDPARWTGENLGDFTRAWAAREFGPDHAADIAAIVDGYAKFNGRRKPELLMPDTYSLGHYREWETVLAGFKALTAAAERIAAALPAEQRAAFQQLALFPTKASMLANALYFAAARNALFARQGRASANEWADAARAVFAQYLGLVADYHGRMADGKWDHFMDQPVFGYTGWRDPPQNNLDHLTFATVNAPAAATMGVAVEGEAAALRFDALARPRRYFEVFNRGKASFTFTAGASAPWIRLSETNATVGEDRRVWVDIDWAKVPPGRVQGEIVVTGAGADVRVPVEAFNPAEVTRATLRGFAESDGYVAIEPEHFSRNLAAGASRWVRLADYGRTLSGMRAEAPVDAPPAAPGRDAACLEYRLYLFSPGPAEVTAITSPVLNFIPGRPVRYAVSFDDEAPQVVTLVPGTRQAVREGQLEWEKSVADNAHHGRSRHPVAAPGYHTLKLWMIDPGVVLQKLVVDLGGAQTCYLGPPESYHSPSTP